MAATFGCYWPDCQERISLNNLAQHIETWHGVKKGFGCDYCGFTDAKKTLSALIRLKSTEDKEQYVQPPKLWHTIIEDDTKKATPNYATHLRKIGGREGPRVNNPPKTAATTAVTSSHLTRKLPSFNIFARSILSSSTWTLRESGVDTLKPCLTSPQALHLLS